jgi:hypothetical protein
MMVMFLFFRPTNEAMVLLTYDFYPIELIEVFEPYIIISRCNNDEKHGTYMLVMERQYRNITKLVLQEQKGFVKFEGGTWKHGH